jgi:hypothetical protein
LNFSDYISNRKQLTNQQKPALINIQEEFWFGSFFVNQVCPYCEVIHEMIISFTKAHVKIECQQENCKKVFFYRRVNLGVIEGNNAKSR